MTILKYVVYLEIHLSNNCDNLKLRADESAITTRFKLVNGCYIVSTLSKRSKRSSNVTVLAEGLKDFQMIVIQRVTKGVKTHQLFRDFVYRQPLRLITRVFLKPWLVFLPS